MYITLCDKISQGLGLEKLLNTKAVIKKLLNIPFICSALPGSTLMGRDSHCMLDHRHLSSQSGKNKECADGDGGVSIGSIAFSVQVNL